MLIAHYPAVRRSQGLGTNWVIDSTGATIDCDSITNFFNSACWGGGTPISALPAGSPIFGGAGTTPQPTTQSIFGDMMPWIAISAAAVVLVLILSKRK